MTPQPYRVIRPTTLLALVLAVSAPLFGLAASAAATTIQWGAGFSGFKTGDVYFVSSVQSSTTGFNRGPTLFVYSPSTDQIAEIVPLFPPFGSPNGYLAFDPTGRGLFIGDVEKIQLLRPDGSLVSFTTTFTTVLDLAVGPDGTVFTSENNGIRRYVDGSIGTQVASVGTAIRGLAILDSGFVTGIDPNTALYGNDNLLWLNSLGAVTQRSQIGTVIPGAAGLVRTRSDGKLIVVSDFRTTLNIVSADGSFLPFADQGDGVFQTDGIAIDALTGLDVWVTTRGRPASLQSFATDGTRLKHVPLELNQLGHTDDPGFFSPSGVVSVLVSSFIDVPTSHLFWPWIEALLQSGITGGCGTNPPIYCPEHTVSRAEMAIFLLRGIHGAGYQPPDASGIFSDVPVDHAFATWIDQLFAERITAGCGVNPLRYCPDNTVTRAHMAVFLLRSKHGAGYQPPDATGLFADVPLSHPFAPWIEQLAREGITGGCATGPARYCPDQPVTRGQMAVFLVRTFDLPM